MDRFQPLSDILRTTDHDMASKHNIWRETRGGGNLSSKNINLYQMDKDSGREILIYPRLNISTLGNFFTVNLKWPTVK